MPHQRTSLPLTITLGCRICLGVLLATAASSQSLPSLRSFPDDLPSHFGVIGVRAHAVDETLHVSKVRRHSPAERSGLRVGDRIIGASHLRLTDADQLSRLVQSMPPGDSLLLHIQRHGATLDLTCQVTDRRHLYFLMMEEEQSRPPPSARHRNWNDTQQAVETGGRQLVERQQAGGTVDTLARAFEVELSNYGTDGRLADIDFLLRQPLKAADAVRDISHSFRPGLPLSDYIHSAASHLDIELVQMQDGSKRQETDLNGLLLSPFQTAIGHVESAFAGLSETERIELREGIEPLLRRFDSTLYLDEGDSAETDAHTNTLRLAKRVDVAHLLRASLTLSSLTQGSILERIDATARNLTRVTGKLPPNFKGDFLHVEQTQWGWFIVGDTTANTYAGPAAIIVDLGGDDTYFASTSVDAPGSVVIDLGGNDHYIGNRPGSVGGALAGVALLVDRAGDDTYSGDLLTQGAAFCGVGVLWDADGDDTYLAQHNAQGIGFFGVGLLVDIAGHDLFSLGQFGQGLGGAHGVGLLLDGGGWDRYVADLKTPSSYGTPDVYNGWSQGIGVGFRGFAPGGLGLLVASGDGDDTYQAGDFSQGTGYFFGLGILADSGGDDHYSGARYAQGAAAHQAVGVLLDDSGDDIYHGSVAANQGAAWDASVAVLVDLAGNDRYQGGGLSQGASAMNGVGWLYDRGGNDSYQTPSGQADGGSTRYWGGRGALNLGLLMDEGGRDDYSRPDRMDGAEFRGSRVGLFLDAVSTP